MVAFVKSRLAKSVSPVVPEAVGVTFVSAPPPALYEPELPTSLPVVYAVVAAVNVALLVYRASLNALPDEAVKLCLASRSSFLKLVHMKLPLKAI